MYTNSIDPTGRLLRGLFLRHGHAQRHRSPYPQRGSHSHLNAKGLAHAGEERQQPAQRPPGHWWAPRQGPSAWREINKI